MYRDTCIGDTVSRIGIAKVVFQSIAYRYRFSPISMYRVSVSLNANLEYRAHHCLSDDLNDFSFLSQMLILNTCLELSLQLREFVKEHGLRKSWKTAQKLADHFWRNCR